LSGTDTYSCPRCARRFVVVAGQRANVPPRCSCGSELALVVLPSGVYELRRSRRATRRRPPRGAARPAAVQREPDLGYGESHGYGPAHGGPSGPGDAPADDAPAPPSAPPAEPESDDDDDDDKP
jgi:hypothetical protein